ncbi:hypothetical protein MNBD_GAMMA03-1468 [hydrothermal vent metagenome]|uniref:Uncharacterized protein n=1 Tax=hydrothermal vent metagenome TaxID=652676 RepID=A0A3B0W058_9ZZZZ
MSINNSNTPRHLESLEWQKRTHNILALKKDYMILTGDKACKDKDFAKWLGFTNKGTYRNIIDGYRKVTEDTMIFIEQKCGLHPGQLDRPINAPKDHKKLILHCTQLVFNALKTKNKSVEDIAEIIEDVFLIALNEDGISDASVSRIVDFYLK